MVVSAEARCCTCCTCFPYFQGCKSTYHEQAQHRAAAETATRKLIGHFKRSMYDFFTGIIIVRYGEKVTELLLTVKNGYCQSW